MTKHTESARPSTAPSRHKLKSKGNPPRNESSDEDSEMSVSKLETIQNLAMARKHDIKSKLGGKPQPKSHNVTQFGRNVVDVCNDKHVEAVVKIQKVWRGYHVRNLSPEIAVLKRDVQSKRHEDHIKKLSDELSSAKAALQVERKLRLLQMEAIKALWREVSFSSCE
jgi:IQ calmodulin-binding motif